MPVIPIFGSIARQKAGRGVMPVIPIDGRIARQMAEGITSPSG